MFKLVQKTTTGQCDAMRCKGTPEQECEVDGRIVNLCTKHAAELQEKPEQPKQDITLPTGSLENILVQNLAVKSGAIESREKQAIQIHEIALAIPVKDVSTRDKADELLSMVHQEEKALKAEVAAMYKPIKDAATATKKRLDSWFGPTLQFYAEAKTTLKEKIGDFIRLEKAKEDVALATGDHETAALCATEASENVRLKREYEYVIENDGINLPIQFLTPNEDRNLEIVQLLPRELLIPNYDLISALVKEHGTLLEIPDVRVIMIEKVQMKGKRS